MKILIARKLPEDFLKYDVVIIGKTVYHSRKVKFNGMVKFENTRWYCHKCFKQFDNEEDWKNHKC